MPTIIWNNQKLARRYMKHSYIRKYQTYFLIIVIFFFSFSCSSVRYDSIPKQKNLYGSTVIANKINSLLDTLMNLSSIIDQDEARIVAETVIIYPMELANHYELTKPPIFHNILINFGNKKRGLCTHWAQDILIKIESLNLKTFKLYWGIANRDNKFRLQHSTAIVSAQDKGFNDGLVFDGWRKSGDLVWAKVTEDKYVWENLYKDPEREWESIKHLEAGKR